MKQHPSNPHPAAFTLVEMLTVIVIIGLLASILLPVLSRAKEKARQGACSSDLRQISLAFQLYWSDNTDLFPAPGSATLYGPQPEDWIWWQYGRGVEHSAIAPHISKFNPRVFTCPDDRRAQLLQVQGEVPGDPYRYSYSLTSYDLSNNVNPGMSTIITPNRQVYPFKSASIKNPNAKIMLVEESDKTINDSRWVPNEAGMPNLISSRHSGRGNVAFADGHMHPETPQFGQVPANSNPTY
jgi:prepilin-type processing-associated H-X9-DG protein/prepilin-type N-terminal cleavage/methylation domain-containing protein